MYSFFSKRTVYLYAIWFFLFLLNFQIRAQSLNFQMINPCGNDGDNEFIAFSTGTEIINISNLAFGVTNDANDASFNYFWGGSNTMPSDYSCVGITSAANNYGFLNPISDQVEIDGYITELNNAAGCTLFLAIPSSGEIPANATVIAFLGASDPFDDIPNNLNFSSHCGDTYYVVFGKGNAGTGYFSNSSTRLSTLDFGADCSGVIQFSYTPESGQPGYIFNGQTYQTGGPCIPSLSLNCNVICTEFPWNGN